MHCTVAKDAEQAIQMTKRSMKELKRTLISLKEQKELLSNQMQKFVKAQTGLKLKSKDFRNQAKDDEHLANKMQKDLDAVKKRISDVKEQLQKVHLNIFLQTNIGIYFCMYLLNCWYSPNWTWRSRVESGNDNRI